MIPTPEQVERQEMKMENSLDNEAKNLGVQGTETGNVELRADFTPGPWSISESKVPGYERTISVINGDRLSVCRLDGAGSSNPNVMRYVRANARLIAAAPTLYAAVKAALEYVDNLNEDTPAEPNCKECTGRVYFAKGTPEPPMCWIHQLEKALKVAGECERIANEGDEK